MESKQVAHLLYTPFTGLGLYGGHRGNRWLRNRIKIYKQFVVPSMQNQTNQNFIVWVSWRFEDRDDPMVQELKEYLEATFGHARVVFTYTGVCFWDDKYPDDVARSRLIDSIHGASGALLEAIGQIDTVFVTIQPSDDCYYSVMVEEMQRLFAANDKLQAAVYRKGYVMDYTTKKLCEWNPKTSPPFYTIKFDKKTLTDALKHVEYAGIKSHEYLPTKLVTANTDTRGFLVGTHGENISTVFNHPFTGDAVSPRILNDFGIYAAAPLTLPISLRKRFMRMLPHRWQRKIRYIFGERGYARFYNWIRS